MSLNVITMIGRLTRDPELKKTQSDISVVSFTLAMERDYSKGNDKQTDFIDITAWRNIAEFVSKYFSKGMQVAVTGRLQIRDWTDKDGNKRKAAEVVADNVYFADSKKTQNDGSPAVFQNNNVGFAEIDDPEDDESEPLPF